MRNVGGTIEPDVDGADRDRTRGTHGDRSSRRKQHVIWDVGRTSRPRGEGDRRTADIPMDVSVSCSSRQGSDEGGEEEARATSTEDQASGGEGGERDRITTRHECSSSSSTHVCQVCRVQGGMRNELKWLQSKMSYS